MKIISWNIGTNNLAYCIMDNKEILEWDKIDILEDIRVKKKLCEGTIKNGNICNKKASLYNIIDENRHYYCKMHGKKKENINPILDHELCYGYNKNNKKCQNKAIVYEDVDNIRKYYCKRHQDQAVDQTKKYISINNISFFEKNQLLYGKLDKLNGILDVDEVIIENQPVYKNPIMKSIQMLLYGYYLINIQNHGRINKIYIPNATQKMTVYNGPKIDCHIKDTHEKNKYLAKEYCKYFLKDNQKMLDYFLSYDKKDDLADTYLQGLYFFNTCSAP